LRAATPLIKNKTPSVTRRIYRESDQQDMKTGVADSVSREILSESQCQADAIAAPCLCKQGA